MRQDLPYLVASVTQLDHMSTKGVLVAVRYVIIGLSFGVPAADDHLSAELDKIAEEFRSNAQRLLHLLQSFTPSAGKLRVSGQLV